MSATVYDGKALIAKLSRRIKRDAERIRKQRHIEVGLGILLVTGDQVSMGDVTKIAAKAEELGIVVQLQRVAQRNVGRKFYPTLEEYAASPFVQGIYIQLPLPTQIVPLSEVMQRLPPEKDVAGLHFQNRGMATYPPHEVEYTVHPPELTAVKSAMEECAFQLKGGKVVIIGSNATTGTVKLLANYLYDRGSNVRVVHVSSIPGFASQTHETTLKEQSATTNELEEIINPDGEAVIAWTNHPGWLTRRTLKKGSLVIDMGYKFARGRISGDCDFPSVSQVADVMTPVPGGIRNIVHVMILQNLISLIQRQLGEEEEIARGHLHRRFGGKGKKAGQTKKVK